MVSHSLYFFIINGRGNIRLCWRHHILATHAAPSYTQETLTLFSCYWHPNQIRSEENCNPTTTLYWRVTKELSHSMCLECTLVIVGHTKIDREGILNESDHVFHKIACYGIEWSLLWNRWLPQIRSISQKMRDMENLFSWFLFINKQERRRKTTTLLCHFNSSRVSTLTVGHERVSLTFISSSLYCIL
jgi:hypothetical protein